MNKFLKILVLISVTCAFTLNAEGQNGQKFRQLQIGFAGRGYSSVKPFLINQAQILYICGLVNDFGFLEDSTATDTIKPPTHKVVLDWCKEHFFENHFITAESENCSLTINPLFIFEARKMKDDTSSYLTRNTRGIEAFGHLGSHISFYTSFYENQGGFFPYEMSLIDSTDVIPGQGHGKEFKDTQLDWAWVTGHLNVRVNYNLELVLGYGKNFIGHGYRSIILSDQAFNYPYLRTQLTFFNNRLYYNSIWAKTHRWNHDSDFVSNNHTFHNASYNILGWNPHVLHGLNISLINGVTWKKSQHCNFWAADLRVSPFDKLNIYAQTRYNKDNIDDNKVGYQVGFEIFDVFELLRINSLLRVLKNAGAINSYRNPLRWHIQAEYNSNPITGLNPRQDQCSFSHYSEPLQFSLEKEKLLITDLTLYNRFEVSLMHSDNTIRKYTDVKLSLIANPTTKWKFYIGCYQRTPAGMSANKFIYFGTSICPEKLYNKEI